MRRSLTNLVLIWSLWAAAADPLENGFFNPPDATKPSCYWYWISDNISREGITRDLEAMARVGIGEAFIGNIYLDDIQAGDVKALTPEWWEMVEHAIREGGRLGVNVGLFNCPGWSQSGGPWIKPDQAMRYVAIHEQRVQGPARFSAPLPDPKQPFQAITTLAFPAPRSESDNLAARKRQSGSDPRLRSPSGLASLERLVDGDLATSVELSTGPQSKAGSVVVEIELDEPMTARSLTLVPGERSFAMQCELLAGMGERFNSVRKFNCDRSQNTLAVGFLKPAPVTVSFPEVRASRFRLVFSPLRGAADLAEVDLSGAARVERFVEKQLGRMHPTPLPMWDAYLWPAANADPPASAVVPTGAVVNLDGNVSAEGVLDWDVPPGEWVIMRAGMTPTGTMNAPASPEGRGLEVDKMNPVAARAHFDAFIGGVLRRMPKKDRSAFKRVIADSYEMGGQNWTDGFQQLFANRYGYDPLPWLPVLTGRVVGSEDQSDRFLWDLRRLVADQVAYGYVGGLRKACEGHGLKLWLENYGHWGFPAEFLQYGGQSHEVSGEFWATGDLGSIELRAASSAAHIYGKPIVSAEAFTSTLQFESTPWSLKKRGDWALTEGINHWVLHVFIHQPWDDRVPGLNAWFSTEFNRHNTWFEHSKDWIDYYRRCHFLLQQGNPVADIAYFIGEDVPKMTGIRSPALPPGYNYDYINAEVILKRLAVRDGHWVLPEGTRYRLLVLPESDTMRPAVLRRIRDLVRAGGNLLVPPPTPSNSPVAQASEPAVSQVSKPADRAIAAPLRSAGPPTRSPSLEGYPDADREVQALVRELWPGDAGPAPVFYSGLKRGKVFRGKELQPGLEALGIGPDLSGVDPRVILWTHRRTPQGEEIYFLSNQSEQPVNAAPVFRVGDQRPELWNPVDRSIQRPGVFSRTDRGLCLPLRLEPRGSMFVIFRAGPGEPNPVDRIAVGGREVINARPVTVPAVAEGDPVNSFTMSLWVRPVGEIALPTATNAGVHLHYARNEAITAFHGDARYPAGGHAGAGVSVGRNGVVVYEHSGSYFAPLLVYPGAIQGWRHLAVVYLEGQPILYLDGQQVATGLRSTFQVHSGLVAEPGGNAGFRGELQSVTAQDRALTHKEVLELAAARPAVPDALAAELARVGPNGALSLEVSAAGEYQIDWADGRRQTLNVPGVPPDQRLTGPWSVRVGGVPELVLDTLGSLTESTNPAVRYCSGPAFYQTEFVLRAADLDPAGRLRLNLGRVESIAEVRLNGRPLGVCWGAPYAYDITGPARAGTNLLEVAVIGTWRNRLIGQAKYPDGLPGRDTPEKRRIALTADPKIRPEEPPAPFGLLGPVRLTHTRSVEVRPPAR